MMIDMPVHLIHFKKEVGGNIQYSITSTVRVYAMCSTVVGEPAKERGRSELRRIRTHI